MTATAGDVDLAGFVVTRRGVLELAQLGVDAQIGDSARACLDWTEQRPHVAGSLGRAILTRLVELGWLERGARTRAVHVTTTGRSSLPARLGVRLPD